MGATEEQMLLVAQSGMDGVSYVLIMYSVAFIMFLFSNMLIHLYDRLANPNSTKGYTSANGHIRLDSNVEAGRVRDAEEFELEGLSSDDEGEGHGMLHEQANGNHAHKTTQN